MKKRIWGAVAVVLAPALIVVLAGCGALQGPTGAQEGEAVVSLSSSFAYHLLGSASKAFVADDVLTGELSATNLDTMETEVFEWSIYLNSTTYETESNKTIVLAPGEYDFALLVQAGAYSYAGEALLQTIEEGENEVEMVLRPIIGAVETEVIVVARLADFRFSYDPGELSVLSAPQIGITVDGGVEEMFAVDPDTGLSEHMFLNLVEGVHEIELRLFDGPLQCGKSIEAQETVDVVAGTDVVMDLVALHGEVMFSLSEEGGEATFGFTIPAEVVAEAGGVANLQTIFSVVGPENPLRQVALTLVPAGGDWEAEVTFDDFQYGEVTMLSLIHI